MNNRMSFGSILARGALGAMATCLVAGAALADPAVVVQSGVRSVTMQKQVRYGDLDLSTAKGRAALDQRVRYAAKDVCDGGNVSNTRTPFAYLDCYTVARRDANQQLNQRLAAVRSNTVLALR